MHKRSLCINIINLLLITIMKYKKHIATGALALSLLVGGSSVFAASPQGVGIKSVQSNYQKNGRKNIIGTVDAVSDTGFTVEIKNMKTKISTSTDVTTNTTTEYSKNGATATASDVTVGEKVIVGGTIDKTTGIVTAKTVKIVPKIVAKIHKTKITSKKTN